MKPIGDISQIDVYRVVQDASKLSGKRIDNREQLKEVSRDFESLFVKVMLDAMRSSLTDATLIPKNAGHKLFEDQLYSEYARKISHSSRLGIADMIYRQLDSTLPSEGSVEIIA